MLAKWFFEFMYRFSRPRWDTGITPPEVVSLVEGGAVEGRRALDLGCGTGTNAMYLARHGFSVVGVDFSRKAIATARDKAARARVQVDFHVSDVTRLDYLHDPFDLITDIGCFHGLAARDRERYAENLARLTRPGSVFLLYALGPRPGGLRAAGLTEEQVRQTFAAHFALRRVDHGTDRGDRVSAWYRFDRLDTASAAEEKGRPPAHATWQVDLLHTATPGFRPTDHDNKGG